MPTIPPTCTAARRSLAVTALLTLTACGVFTTAPQTGSAPAPSPGRADETAPSAAAGEIAVHAPAAGRAPEAPTHGDPEHEIAVLFASDQAGHADIAARLAELWSPDAYRVARVDIRAADASAAIEALRDRPEIVAVAVGLDAVESARAALRGHPIVFCQVFNYQEFLREGASTWGVHSVPPLVLQLRAWQAVDGSLRRIGLIVSDTQMQWLDDAAKAAAEVGAELHYEVSASDRETLYLFKRLAPQVDGFWLLPDNTILSPGVLQDLLGYAVSHDVGVLVFNEALLEWGALMSASSTPANVARTVHGVVERVVTDQAASLPAMTPLSEVSLQFNAAVARELGLDIVPESSWVLREFD